MPVMIRQFCGLTATIPAFIVVVLVSITVGVRLIMDEWCLKSRYRKKESERDWYSCVVEGERDIAGET